MEFKNFNPVARAKDAAQELILTAMGRAVADGMLPEAAAPAFNIEIPGDLKNGDLASNAAMVGARAFRLPPRKIAEILVEHADCAGTPFDHLEVAGPGFINFFLSHMVEMGMLALIVVFQPEIRRFLEQLGSTSLGDVFSREEAPPEVEEAIAQTVQAYAALSRDKVGALMVFERQNLLDDIIKTGTPLDCSVSSELLKNLFWNKAPLHDGAVIVRKGRIVGAGCMLPLSSNVNLSRDLGMRHRAGIGMSEHSDAVVVIVSEETGSISAAVGGLLKRHLAPETLEQLLRNELMSDKKEERKTAQIPWLGQLFGGNRKGGDR